MAVDTLARTLAAGMGQNVTDVKIAMQEMEAEFETMKAMVGTPLVAATASAMTDHNKIYVYVKSPAESGYTTGHWYYWNGSAWADGGVYNSIALETDKTLSISDMAADAKVTGDDITNLKNAIIDYNAYNILDLQSPSDYAWNGITYDWNSDGSCTVTGTATSTSFCNIYMNQNALPDGIKAGDILNIQYSSSKNIYFYIYDYTGGSTSVLFGATSGGQIRIPTTCTGLIIRLWIGANTGPGSAGETVKPCLLNYNRILAKKPTNYGAIAAAAYGAYHLFSSANDVDEDCRLFVSVNSGTTNITDVPSWAGELETIITTGSVATQFYYPYEPEKHPVMIRGKIGGTWGTWIAIGQRGYIEAVDSASESETGKVNMTPAIKYALDTYGYCKLGPGVFYLQSLVIMPDGSTVEGCGDATQVRLLHITENNNGCFEMHNDCTVRGMSLFGQYADLASSDFTSTSGTRYGILHMPRNGGTCGHCVIENVSISNFTGSGIYQYNTGQNVKQGLFVTDVDIKNCWAGIHNHSLAEFSRYENVRMTYCYIAAINNSGNCMWNNCVFHAYSIGMQMDGTRQNAGHGSCSNSSFCHTGNNTGSAITMSSLTQGYVFSANQFWYNSIDITGSESVVFSACEMGRGTTGAGMNINISGGNTIMFDGCVFWNDTNYAPAISIINNTKTKFMNCYGGSSGNAITA